MSAPRPPAKAWNSHPLLHLAKVVATVAVTELVIMWGVLPHLPTTSAWMVGLADTLLLTLIAGPLIWWGSVRPFQRIAEQERCLAEERNLALSNELQRRGLERRLADGLEVASTEAEALAVVRAVLGEICPTSTGVVMIADPVNADFRQRIQVGLGETCNVRSPNECPAVLRMRTVVFDADDPVVRCPCLHDVSVDAICVPVSILGRSAGIIQRCRTPASTPPDPNERRDLHALATHVGSRIGTLRALAEIRRQATTDGLTGVFNRRAARGQIAALIDAGQPFSVTMVDFDEFKRINDVHGHHTGDLALVAFCRLAEDVLGTRGGIGRWGGEEFLVWAPLDQGGMTVLLEELRARLRSLSEPGVPRFSATYGTTQYRHGDTVDATLQRCDKALYRGKEAGGDRVILA